MQSWPWDHPGSSSSSFRSPSSCPTLFINSPLGAAITEALNEFIIVYPSTDGLTPVTDPSTIFNTGRFSIGFNATTGSYSFFYFQLTYLLIVNQGGIGYLMDSNTNTQWVGCIEIRLKLQLKLDETGTI